MRHKLILWLIAVSLSLYACTNTFMEHLLRPDQEQSALPDGIFFTVSFNTGGGSAVPSQTVAQGARAIRPPTHPTRDGQGFVNWYSNSGLTVLYNFNTPVTADITLYAKWGTPCIVTFNSNGGSAVAAQTVGEGGTANRPANPSREGYTLDNWYTDDVTFADAYNFSTLISGNLNLYAKWNVIPVSGITLNATALNLSGSGSTGTLTATVTPSNALNKNVTWSSSDNNVATVSDGGVVTAVNGGTAIITATSAADSSKTASCTVTVNVPVTGVALDKPTLTLTGSGTTDTLTATVAPANATNKSITWTSSNSAVAAVSDSGLVTAVSVGTAIITVRTADGGHTATCTVTVNPVSVSGVSLNENTLALNKGGTATLSATVAPPNATTKTVTWSTSASGVATVNANGLVSAVGGGSAVITVRTNDGSFEATCNVTVTVPVTGVTLNRTTLLLDKGGTETLIATVAPSDATNKNVTWASGTPSVATVNSATGEVTAVGGGTAVITVTSAADSSKTATCTVTVNVPVTGVSLDKTTLTLTGSGDTDTLIAEIAPPDALNKNITWSISPSGVATVNNGLVTAVSVGTATITVTTADGNRTATCIVTVNPVLVTDVSLNKTTTSINVNGTETLSATVAPANATNKTVTWSSDTPSVATVDTNGLVRAVGGGTAVITVTSAADSSKTASCTVTVIVPVTGVTLNKTSTSLNVGATETLIATVAPATATNQNVSWSSSNTDVATVINGTVTAVAAGTATITVTTVGLRTDGQPATATCTVTVKGPMTITVSIDPILDQAPTISGGTISQSGTTYAKTLVMNVTGTYSSYQWSIDGNIIAGEIGNSFTVNAETSTYNNIGKHTVYLLVYKDGVPYSTTISFEVVR